MLHVRRQRTIGCEAVVRGVALFSGADVALRFRPAPEGHGVAFRRVDLPGSADVPATIAFAVDRHRRTGVANGEAVVEMTEHVLAALAGLHVDNCLVEVDGPECPGLDGSALPLVEALCEAGFVEQRADRRVVVVEDVVEVVDGDASISVEPHGEFVVEYDLDYGENSPVPTQSVSLAVTPEAFDEGLAAARTFVLEREVEMLRANGYGARTTARDLLVFGADGPIDNALRWPNECARHKALDCVGDLALLGADVRGRVRARRSGHQLNRDLVRRLVGELALDRDAGLGKVA